MKLGLANTHSSPLLLQTFKHVAANLDWAADNNSQLFRRDWIWKLVAKAVSNRNSKLILGKILFLLGVDERTLLDHDRSQLIQVKLPSDDDTPRDLGP